MPNRSLTFILAAGSCCAAVAAAHAGTIVTQKTAVTSEQFQAMAASLSPQQRAHLGKSNMSFLSGTPVQTVTYISGANMRADVGPISYIYRSGANKATVVNRTAHTYSESFVAPNAAAARSNGVAPKIKDLGPGKNILGHATRHYKVTVTGPIMMGGTVTGDVYTAPDLPQITATALGAGPAAAIQQQLKRLKGMPLQLNMVLSGSSLGKVTVHTVTTSVRTAALGASIFGVPRGYHLTTAAAGGAMGMYGGR